MFHRTKCSIACAPSRRINPLQRIGSLQPLAIQDCIAGTHRVRRGVLGSSLPPGEISAPQREGWYMQRYSQGRQRWDDLYFFTEQEWREVDYRIPNFWCSNRHPLFCKVCSVPSGRKLLGRIISIQQAANHDCESRQTDCSKIF